MDDHDDRGHDEDGGLHIYVTDFTALNNSGVDGFAVLFLDEQAQTLRVHIRAEGLEPNRVHPQHIHGFPDDRDARSPTIREDADRDGFVELAEGLVQYGPVQLNLSLNPETTAQNRGATAVFPTVGEDGVLRYQETFRFERDGPDAQAIFDDIVPLGAKEVVLHGLSVAEGSGRGTGGEVDGTGGYKAILPVASGELREVDYERFLHDASHDDRFGAAVDWIFGSA